jgi:hypothetical protein
MMLFVKVQNPNTQVEGLYGVLRRRKTWGIESDAALVIWWTLEGTKTAGMRLRLRAQFVSLGHVFVCRSVPSAKFIFGNFSLEKRREPSQRSGLSYTIVDPGVWIEE